MKIHPNDPAPTAAQAAVLSERADDAGQVRCAATISTRRTSAVSCVKGAALGETTGLAGRLLTLEVDGQQVAWPQALRETPLRACDRSSTAARTASGGLLRLRPAVNRGLLCANIADERVYRRGEHRYQFTAVHVVSGHWLQAGLGADVVPCSYEAMWKTAIWCGAGRLERRLGAHPVLFQRLAQAKRIIPDCGSWRIDPDAPLPARIADRHLALAPGSDGGLFAGCLTPG